MTEPASARQTNRAAVLREVLREPGVTRQKVASWTGLSTATISRVTDELIVEGYLHEGQQTARRGRGRRSTYLELSDQTGCVVGVDLGATGCKLLAADLRGVELGRRELDTPRQLSSVELAKWLVTQIYDLLAASNVTRQLVGVTVGVPASVEKGRGITRPATDVAHLEGEDLHDALTDQLSVPVTLDTDSNLALEGEMADGLAMGARNVVLFTLSTGMSAAIALDGELLRHDSGLLGEFGWLRCAPDGPTLEECLTTHGILAAARVEGAPLHDITDLTRVGLTRELKPFVRRFIDGVALAVSCATVTVDPDVVLLTGRMRPLMRHVLPEVRSRLDNMLPNVPDLVITSSVRFSTAHGAAAVAARARVTELLIQLNGSA